MRGDSKLRRPPAPRRALRAEEAADSLGLSDDVFRREVAPQLRVVRLGRVRLYPLAEIDGWLERNAALTLEDMR